MQVLFHGFFKALLTSAALSAERKPLKVLAGLAVLVLGMYVFVIPKAVVPAVEWGSDHDAALATAARTGKPTIIDFTADWCLTCKVNERTVLAQASVRQAMERLNVVPLKADYTRRDPEIGQWLKRFGKAGVPFYLVIPGDTSQAPIAMPEFITPSSVVEALERGAGVAAPQPVGAMKAAGGGWMLSKPRGSSPV